MRLIAVSTVRNEADIVEASVRHTATFTQSHLIVDHGSTDGTDEILEALAAEGMALDITRFDAPAPTRQSASPRWPKWRATDMAPTGSSPSMPTSSSSPTPANARPTSS